MPDDSAPAGRGAEPARAAVLVEACVDAIDSAIEAERGGAGRLELCGELLQGGVTPSSGLIAAVRERTSIPLFVLIRPRTGDFTYSPDELDVMRRDIAQARLLGADGVVFGALDERGEIASDLVRELVEFARPMQVTFHRAFDFVADPLRALGTLVETGVDRVLTSGGAASALEGAPMIQSLVARASGAIGILAGGAITAANVAQVVRATGVREVHLRAAVRVSGVKSASSRGASIVRAPLPDASMRERASAEELQRVMAALRSH